MTEPLSRKVSPRKLREFRLAAGLTQRQLASESGHDRQTIIRAENGQQEPNPATMTNIAGALGVRVADLLEGDGPQIVEQQRREVINDDDPWIYTHALHAALDKVRQERGLKWVDVAEQTGVSIFATSRLQFGQTPNAEAFGALVAWGVLNANNFIRRPEDGDEGWKDRTKRMEEARRELDEFIRTGDKKAVKQWILTGVRP